MNWEEKHFETQQERRFSSPSDYHTAAFWTKDHSRQPKLSCCLDPEGLLKITMCLKDSKCQRPEACHFDPGFPATCLQQAQVILVTAIQSLLQNEQWSPGWMGAQPCGQWVPTGHVSIPGLSASPAPFILPPPLLFPHAPLKHCTEMHKTGHISCMATLG